MLAHSPVSSSHIYSSSYGLANVRVLHAGSTLYISRWWKYRVSSLCVRHVNSFSSSKILYNTYVPVQFKAIWRMILCSLELSNLLYSSSDLDARPNIWCKSTSNDFWLSTEIQPYISDRVQRTDAIFLVDSLDMEMIFTMEPCLTKVTKGIGMLRNWSMKPCGHTRTVPLGLPLD